MKDRVNELFNLLDLDEMNSKKMRAKAYQEDIFCKLMEGLRQCVFPKVTTNIDSN